ncbi:hypothetical protein HS041_22415 [Planomonospora sp. ID67723]|uniref:hypothetical protein n=1 Tax=Planomonospora sp. ID67723 TaxID=2738134 RepID=UPI0018C365A2|nr:hypothetical protein [Planomonospora sp. ID67723]MBG0830519.1 hypothetical protein [Planomonospora sp. ID67723]
MPIRTTAGLILFRDGRAVVESPELAQALREVPAVFGITEEGAGSEARSPAPPRPAKSAPVKAWEDWAVSRGMDRGQAEDATKAQLIALADDLLADEQEEQE